ncbi:MAG: hypothetical protein P1V97_13730 [Planctomycetota bacterium]|nr:hypothetical protein [Planctomycetota bacterium]
MSPKMRFLKYFDKAFLSLAALWLISVMTSFATASVFDPNGLNERIDQIASYTRDHKAKTPELPDWETPVRENLEAKRVPGVRAFPTWVLHNRPNLVFEFNIPPDDCPKLPWTPPSDLTVKAGRESMQLSWKMAEIPAILIVDEMTLLRAKRSQVSDESLKNKASRASQVFKTIAKLNENSTQYTDKTVNHRIEYIYKIQVTVKFDAEHPRCPKDRHISENDRKKESQVSKGTLLPIKFLVPLMIRLPGKLADLDAKSRVDLRVYLYDANSEKKWIFRDYWNVEEGELIGSVINKRGRTFDFRMGKLVKPTIIERPNPKIPGHMKKVYKLEVSYPDSTVEKYNSRTELNRLKAS